MPIDIKTESLWYRNPDGTYTEFRAVAPAIDDELSGNSEAPVQNKVITNALNKLSQDKQDKLTFDSTPTEESDNPVTSQGIKAALDTKLDIPEEPGTPDQVLGLDENLIPHWTDKDNSEDYAPVLINSASGEIASFNDGAANRKIRKLDVHLSPIQDLHGYDSPWPAGGGKNKFDYDTAYTSFKKSDGTFRGTASQIFQIHYNIPSELIGSQVTFSTFLDLTDSGTLTWIRCRAMVSESWVNGNSILNGANGYSSVTFTPTSTEDYVTLEYGSNGGNQYAFYDIQLEVGSSRTTFSPYSNICPISGRESVEVEATGINIWDEEWELGAYNHNTGAKIPSSNTIRSKNYIPIVGGNSYAFRAVSLGYAYLFYYDANNAYISRETPNISSGFAVFTPPSDAKYLGFYAYGTQNTFSISINYPSTDHDYHPYSGNRYTIQLGETVYGGTLDVTAGTLTVDRAMVDLGTLTYTRAAANMFYSFALKDIAVFPSANSQPANVVCDSYATYSFITLRDNSKDGVALRYDDKTFRIKNINIDDAAEIKTSLSGVMLVYELATPIAITLDPVQIATIANQTNNVFSPDGDVTVEYAADIKTYIDNKIAAAVAALS